MFGIAASTVQPHVALGLGILSLLVQNLQLRLVRMKQLALKELIVKLSINGSQPIVGATDQPVGHGLLQVPFLLLPVQRRAHHKYLHSEIRWLIDL